MCETFPVATTVARPAIATTTTSAISAVPARLRVAAASRARLILAAIARPTIVWIAIRPISTSPNLCPALVRAASAKLSWLRGCSWSAQAVAIIPPNTPSPRIIAARRRSGTSTNHTAIPTTAMTTAPRE